MAVRWSRSVDLPPEAGRRREPGYGWHFIDLAELGLNTGRSYAATAARVVLYPLVAAALLAALAVFVLPRDAFFVVVLIQQYGLIVIAGAALAAGVVRSHRRPLLSLVAADLQLDGRRLAIGLAVELAILAGQLALAQALSGWRWRLSLEVAWPVAVLAGVLIPLQAASEELLFRGYLTQALGRLARSRVAIALVVAIVFGALHLAAYGGLTLPYFLVLSLIFSLVSLRDERLELAIGGHAGMNLFAFAAAGSGILRPAALAPAAAAMPFNGAAIAVLVVNGALFYGLTRLLVRLLCRPAPAP